MGRVMQIASFSLAEVTYTSQGLNIGYLISEQVKTASFRVKARSDNVSGVILPAFESDRTPGSGECLSFLIPVCEVWDSVETRCSGWDEYDDCRIVSSCQPHFMLRGSDYPFIGTLSACTF